ncbi:F0F1 ATP synthase subunit A [Rhodococcus hoagii]|nr:F0F1 ATP synthase subunit A [Prescottella equi]
MSRTSGEYALDFVRINIAEEIWARSRASASCRFITTIFFIVLASNIASVNTPFLNFLAERTNRHAARAGGTWPTSFNYVGIKKYGFFKYVKSSVVVPGVPLPLHFLLIPIEFLSTSCSAVHPDGPTLANMLAGHHPARAVLQRHAVLLLNLRRGPGDLRRASIIAGVRWTFFELLVIGLQAYVLRAAHRRVHRLALTPTRTDHSHR